MNQSEKTIEEDLINSFDYSTHINVIRNKLFFVKICYNMFIPLRV
jgi:hypothetical protein